MRKLLVRLSLALALLLPAACSGSEGNGPEPEGTAEPDTSPLAQLMGAAAGKVSAARTYRFEGTVLYPVGTGRFDVSMKGTADTGSGKAVGEAQVEPFTTMELDLSRSPLAGARGGVVRMVLDGGTFYMRFPDGPQPGTGTGPGGKLWGQFDVSALDRSAAGFKLLLDKARDSEPARYLALMSRARGVTEVGTEKVRDVDARHFTMTAGIEETAGNAPSEFAPAARRMLEGLGAVPVTVEVWLGPDDLPRRVSYSVDRSLKRDLTNATIELFDYGAPIERTVPPAAEIFDFTGLTEVGK